MMFAHEMTPKIKKEYPELKVMEVGRMCGKKWNEQTEDMKKTYEQRAKKEKSNNKTTRHKKTLLNF